MTIAKLTDRYDYVTIMRGGTRFFFIGSIVLFLMYLYFVGAVTFTVVQRRNMEEGLKTLSSDVSKEELRYLSAEKGLTKDVALNRGFVEPSKLTFTGPKNAVAWNATR